MGKEEESIHENGIWLRQVLFDQINYLFQLIFSLIYRIFDHILDKSVVYLGGSPKKYRLVLYPCWYLKFVNAHIFLDSRSGFFSFI
jgi:hypothetical protein